MDGKALAGKYKDFANPGVKIYVGDKEIDLKGNRFLESVEITSTTKREPDMAVIVYTVSRRPVDNINSFERYIKVGEKIEIKLGYEKNMTTVFCGYLHEAQVFDYQEEALEYTLIGLDVKGLMKKNSCFQISGSKNTEQIMKDIIDTRSYTQFITKKTISKLPASMNQDCVIKGETHYDWLCYLADILSYEFFCGRGELVFRKARQGGQDTYSLTGEYGVKAVRTLASMTGQTGNVQINGYNRKDEKISGTAKWPGVSGPFSKGLSSMLRDYGYVLMDMGLETKEQAAERAKAVLDREIGRCSRMEILHIGVPELQPGVYVTVTTENVESLSGTIYVDETSHVLDRDGYRTVVRGSRK